MIQPQRVLIADDNNEMRNLFQLAFEGQGFRVQTAYDGLEAQAILRGTPPDLLVIDMDMPQMTGLEVVVWARQQMHLLGLKIIMVTGHTQSRMQAQAQAADVCLVKPVALKVLLGHAHHLLQGLSYRV